MTPQQALQLTVAKNLGTARNTLAPGLALPAYVPGMDPNQWASRIQAMGLARLQPAGNIGSFYKFGNVPGSFDIGSSAPGSSTIMIPKGPEEREQAIQAMMGLNPPKTAADNPFASGKWIFGDTIGGMQQGFLSSANLDEQIRRDRAAEALAAQKMAADERRAREAREFEYQRMRQQEAQQALQNYFGVTDRDRQSAMQMFDAEIRRSQLLGQGADEATLSRLGLANITEQQNARKLLPEAQDSWNRMLQNEVASFNKTSGLPSVGLVQDRYGNLIIDKNTTKGEGFDRSGLNDLQARLSMSDARKGVDAAVAAIDNAELNAQRLKFLPKTSVAVPNLPNFGGGTMTVPNFRAPAASTGLTPQVIQQLRAAGVNFAPPAAAAPSVNAVPFAVQDAMYRAAQDYGNQTAITRARGTASLPPPAAIPYGTAVPFVTQDANARAAAGLHVVPVRPLDFRPTSGMRSPAPVPDNVFGPIVQYPVVTEMRINDAYEQMINGGMSPDEAEIYRQMDLKEAGIPTRPPGAALPSGNGQPPPLNPRWTRGAYRGPDVEGITSTFLAGERGALGDIFAPPEPPAAPPGAPGERPITPGLRKALADIDAAGRAFEGVGYPGESGMGYNDLPPTHPELYAQEMAANEAARVQSMETARQSALRRALGENVPNMSGEPNATPIPPEEREAVIRSYLANGGKPWWGSGPYPGVEAINSQIEQARLRAAAQGYPVQNLPPPPSQTVVGGYSYPDTGYGYPVPTAVAASGGAVPPAYGYPQTGYGYPVSAPGPSAPGPVLAPGLPPAQNTTVGGYSYPATGYGYPVPTAVAASGGSAPVTYPAAPYPPAVAGAPLPAATALPPPPQTVGGYTYPATGYGYPVPAAVAASGPGQPPAGYPATNYPPAGAPLPPPPARQPPVPTPPFDTWPRDPGSLTEAEVDSLWRGSWKVQPPLPPPPARQASPPPAQPEAPKWKKGDRVRQNGVVYQYNGTKFVPSK